MSNKQNLIQVLINAAEKSANIARLCRSDKNLLELLTEEKKEKEANPRFVKDFKTLADVLIQETIRHDVGIFFPEIEINGEESSTFTNTKSETVQIKVGNTVEETKYCLKTVLDGNIVAADLLALEVHNTVIYNKNIGNIPNFPDNFDFSKISIWIDPIDATAEYIAGETVFSNFPGITSSGLDCVTVLIGVFSKEDGLPILGVINQPFFKKVEKSNSYESIIYWGVALNNLKANNIPENKEVSSKIALFSTSENPKVLEKIKCMNYELAFSAGAGHKALKIILGDAIFFLLTKGTTFKWDTCAPQAILQSMGGGICTFKLSLEKTKIVPLTYFESENNANAGGIIAYLNEHVLDSVLKSLKDLHI